MTTAGWGHRPSEWALGRTPDRPIIAEQRHSPCRPAPCLRCRFAPSCLFESTGQSSGNSRIATCCTLSHHRPWVRCTYPVGTDRCYSSVTWLCSRKISSIVAKQSFLSASFPPFRLGMDDADACKCCRTYRGWCHSIGSLILLDEGADTPPPEYPRERQWLFSELVLDGGICARLQQAHNGFKLVNSDGIM